MVSVEEALAGSSVVLSICLLLCRKVTCPHTKAVNPCLCIIYYNLFHS